MAKTKTTKTDKDLKKRVEDTQLDPIETMTDVLKNLETQLNHYKTMVIKAEGAIEVVRQLQPKEECNDC